MNMCCDVNPAGTCETFSLDLFCSVKIQNMKMTVLINHSEAYNNKKVTDCKKNKHLDTSNRRIKTLNPDERIQIFKAWFSLSSLIFKMVGGNVWTSVFMLELFTLDHIRS